MRTNLDMLQEVQEVAHIKEYVAKARATQKYNTKVFPQKLKKGDLVLRRTLKDGITNKLTPKWEGPYIIMEYDKRILAPYSTKKIKRPTRLSPKMTF
ncbi:hypothetical protein CR513_47689, partial [Mucuna pruriens]